MLYHKLASLYVYALNDVGVRFVTQMFRVNEHLTCSQKHVKFCHKPNRLFLNSIDERIRSWLRPENQYMRKLWQNYIDLRGRPSVERNIGYVRSTYTSPFNRQEMPFWVADPL